MIELDREMGGGLSIRWCQFGWGVAHLGHVVGVDVKWVESWLSVREGVINWRVWSQRAE